MKTNESQIRLSLVPIGALVDMTAHSCRKASAVRSFLRSAGEQMECSVLGWQKGVGNICVMAGWSSVLASKDAAASEIHVLVCRGAFRFEEALLVLLADEELSSLVDPIQHAEILQAIVAGGFYHRQIAERLGVSRMCVSNWIRLLDLPDRTQGLLRSGLLSASHGRALLRWVHFPDLLDSMARLAVQTGISSKDLEKRALPMANVLWSHGSVVDLRQPGVFFDLSICNKCPFGARVEQDGREWCVLPGHFEELQAANVSHPEIRGLFEAVA